MFRYSTVESNSGMARTSYKVGPGIERSASWRSLTARSFYEKAVSFACDIRTNGTNEPGHQHQRWSGRDCDQGLPVNRRSLRSRHAQPASGIASLSPARGPGRDARGLAGSAGHGAVGRLAGAAERVRTESGSVGTRPVHGPPAAAGDSAAGAGAG